VSGTLTPSPAADDANKPSDVNNSETQTIESQPMTVSNSSSSNPSLKDGTGVGAAPYGTRSRNRTGNPRPNYAEDKELDAEFELSPAKEPPVQKGGGLVDSSSASDVAQQSSGARKGAVVEPEAGPEQKDLIPGTSTFPASVAASSSAQVSKKRKATGQPAAPPPPPPPNPANNILAAQLVDRRATGTAQVVPGFRETNMLAFDVCGGRLKNKKLVADDGTMLEVNGRFITHCSKTGGG